MNQFTSTQGRYLAFIRAYIEAFGIPPAEAEIAKAVGVSPPSANQMMKTLERKGLIRRQAGVARSIQILADPASIPRWTGGRLTRTIIAWRRNPRAEPKKPAARDTTVYCLKIALCDTRPAIWRRIETKDVTLEGMHELIQTAMGWTNSHLHQFLIGEVRYTHPRLMDDDFGDCGAVDYSDVRLSKLVENFGSGLRMFYEYDFGDGWEHDVTLEKVAESEPGIRYPRCTDGARACPPEDVGGVGGFAHFVEAINNPKHSEHMEFLEWNGPFDPAEFDANEATRRMARGLPNW